MGLAAAAPNPQNDQSTGDKPVHKYIKAVFRSSIWLQHISIPDGNSRQPRKRHAWKSLRKNKRQTLHFMRKRHFICTMMHNGRRVRDSPTRRWCLCEDLYAQKGNWWTEDKRLPPLHMESKYVLRQWSTGRATHGRSTRPVHYSGLSPPVGIDGIYTMHSIGLAYVLNW